MKLFVGNVPSTATQEDIMQHFGRYGVENVKTVRDQETGRNRSYCFAYLPDEYAQQAIEELNNTEFMGSTIVVTRSDRTTRRSVAPHQDAWKYKNLAQPRR